MVMAGMKPIPEALKAAAGLSGSFELTVKAALSLRFWGRESDGNCFELKGEIVKGKAG
jgi:hypothetical protein